MNILVNRADIFALSIATTALLLASGLANAEIYKWRNDRGVIQYTDKPPVAGFTKANRHELVNSLQAKDLCAEPTAKTAAAASATKKINANFFGYSGGFSLTPTTTTTTTNSLILKPYTVVATAPKPVVIAPAPAPVPVAVTPKPVVVATAPTTTPTTPVPTAPAPVVSTPPSTSPNILQSGLMPAVDISKQTAAVAGDSILKVQSTTEKPTISSSGAFRVACGFSHMSNDDPIIYPNQQGAAHHHTFFGNTSANFKTSPSTLSTTGNSTCSGGIMNRSAYWVPSMIDTATKTPIKPNYIVVYYKTDSPSKVVQPPKGLRMIAGDSKSTVPQREGLVRFTCNEDYNTRKQHIPACSQGQSLEELLAFPNCWDGINLDSPDHKSHMAYRVGSTCPATHPVSIPDITFNVSYKVSTPGGTANWRHASDNYTGGLGGSSFHGDWMNGWDENFSKAFTDNCLKKSADCHAHLLGDGRMYY